MNNPACNAGKNATGSPNPERVQFINLNVVRIKNTKTTQ